MPSVFVDLAPLKDVLQATRESLRRDGVVLREGRRGERRHDARDRALEYIARRRPNFRRLGRG